MFVAALFTIAKSWKQPRCPSVGEWINKLWYIQTTQYYSALKRDDPLTQEKTWGNLKCTLLSERSQSEKAYTVRFQLYDILEKANFWTQLKDQCLLVGVVGAMTRYNTENF